MCAFTARRLERRHAFVLRGEVPLRHHDVQTPLLARRVCAAGAQEIYEAFNQYKQSIPTCGAMLLNSNSTKAR